MTGKSPGTGDEAPGEVEVGGDPADIAAYESVHSLIGRLTRRPQGGRTEEGEENGVGLVAVPGITDPRKFASNGTSNNSH